MLLRTCRQIAGFDPDIRHRSDDIGVIVGLVAAGAVAITSSLVWPQRESGTVQRPLLGVRLEREIFAAARPASARRPTVEALRDALRESWDGHHDPRRRVLTRKLGV